MKGILVLSLVLSVFVVSGCVNVDDHRPWGRMPPGWNLTNFTLDGENISRVSGFFENAGSQEEVNEYCRERMFECMYYCRNVDPGHEFCAGIIDFRDRGGLDYE